jgi:hypothetical protein
MGRNQGKLNQSFKRDRSDVEDVLEEKETGNAICYRKESFSSCTFDYHSAGSKLIVGTNQGRVLILQSETLDLLWCSQEESSQQGTRIRHSVKYDVCEAVTMGNLRVPISSF